MVGGKVWKVFLFLLLITMLSFIVKAQGRFSNTHQYSVPDYKGMPTIYMETANKIKADKTYYGLNPNFSYTRKFGKQKLPIKYFKIPIRSNKNSSNLTTINAVYTNNKTPEAEFNGYFKDYGIDTNNNSIYEYLIIEIGLNVYHAGYFRLGGSLAGINNSQTHYIAETYNVEYLEAGNQTMKLYFTGPAFYRSSINSTFTLKYLWLLDHDENYELIEAMYDAYTTLEYTYTHFEKPYVEFTDNYFDYGNDADQNGLYDFLSIVVGINITREGEYTIIGFLYDQYLEWITYNYQNLDFYLEEGLRNITIDLPGIDIRNYKSEGPYSIRIRIEDEYKGVINVNKNAYITNYYNYTEFETKSATFTGAYSDYAIDVDGDGYYNYLAIEAEIFFNKSGLYCIVGHLHDIYDKQVTEPVVYCNVFQEGLNNVSLLFNGAEINSYGINGPYNLYFVGVWDHNRIWVDSLHYVYNTSRYNYTQFDEPHSLRGYVFDSSGNTLFNVSIELEDEVNWYYYHDMTTINGSFKFADLQDTLYKLGINEDPTMKEFTAMEFDDENIINLTDDLEINVTLLRIDTNVELNTLSFNNGDTIEANVTVTNKETFDLTDWLFAIDVWFENETYDEDIYFNLTPMNLSAGETKSHIFTYQIPDNNTYSELYIFGGTGKLDWEVISSKGVMKALIYKGEDIIINVQESDLDKDGIPDSQDADDDNDGINDTEDNLLGNESNIESNLENLSIQVDSSENISKIFYDLHNIQIFSDSELVVEFDYNFSYEILNLHSVEIYKQTTTDKGSLLIIGINLPGNLTKTVYLDDLDETIDSICIKDEEILSIDEISMDCNGANEILLDCTGASFNNYTCIDIGDKYKIEGLKHSGVIELASLKSFSINLLEGWNLISIPLELPDKLVSSMLPNLTIFGYKNNSWFTPTEIENKLGYWLKINESKNLTLIGTEIENITIGLNKGWNLISYPSLNTTLVNESLKDVTYDSILTYKDNKWLSHSPTKPPYLNTLKNLTPFYGYWIKVPQNTTWTFDSTFR